ncbi:hypothetical protein OH76DRAFT_1480884 [Lentinus brumalis]|uniref:Uncharacterized protein n=1 Tax=Lentinus brumalis TaxID=2498619 RepID=A0A371DIE1_9APHY|nr:hypothetical protein OH76DRAFT_1480884 [Polyporus brumalis]
MPGTVICFDCQISGGSTSGVFFTLSGSSSTSPTATGSNTIDSHRGAHGPARGSDFPSKLRSSSSVSTTSRASPPLISFPGGPIANITTTGTSSHSSISSSASASAVSSASSNGLSGSKVAAIVLVTGVVAIVTCILLLLWWVSIRRKYRRSWIRIEEAEAKARGELDRAQLKREGLVYPPNDLMTVSHPRLHLLGPLLSPQFLAQVSS